MHYIFAAADLERDIGHFGVQVVLYAALLMIILVAIAASLKNKRKYNWTKKPLFLSMAAVLSISTILLFGGTIYLNSTSDSGGPVHYHADIEFWACGNELALANPHGKLSNKVGTPTLHEHNDKRIHLEGVIVNEAYDASLGKFMKVIGGTINDDRLVVPLADGLFETRTDGDGPGNAHPEYVQAYIGAQPVSIKADASHATQFFDSARMASGTCNGVPAAVQTFVYTYDTHANTYSQTKFEGPQNYTIRDEPNVPPGDCVIVEFDVPKTRTNKLCEQYGVRDKDRCASFGVSADKRARACTIRSSDRPQLENAE